jgi:uncharacterized protein (TIGR03437 family)
MTKIAGGLIFCLALARPLAAQRPALIAQAPAIDTSGNGMLSGTYSFRHVLYVLASVPDSNGITGDLGQTIAVYGNISFDGNGHYMIANGIVSDSDTGINDPLSCYLANAICTTGVPVGGSYSISASGFGFLTNPISEDLIYGLVSANGVFAGSSTETTLAYKDLFIGAPAGPALSTSSTFQGSYTVAGFIPGASPLNSADVFFQMNADGAGNLGTVNITGYSGGGPPTISQSSSVTYSFSGGAATLNFPMDPTANFYSGPELLYFSPDGNFFFGGSPATGYDMIVGVRNTTDTQNFAGLFYLAGLDQDESQLSSGNADLDGYYGSFDATSDGNIIAHQRLSDFDAGVQGVTFADSFTLPVTGSFTGTTTSAQYAVGAGGAIRIGQGTWPLLGLSVALQAPAFTPSGPVYLNPTGIVNSASYAPFTAGVSNGELITLYGVNLAGSTVVSPTVPYPTMLGGVQVMVNGIAAPIYYVTAGAVSIIVPFEVASTAAQFQVINNGTSSNVVTELVNQTTPGVFTASSNGLGYGAVTHDSDGTPVSPSSPAQPGENVSVVLTGLGNVSPPVADGAAAPSNPSASTSNPVTASIGGVAATVNSASLAPGSAGIYQVDLQIPSGAAAGDNVLGISGPDSSAMQALISIGGGQTASSAARHQRSHSTAPARWTQPCFFPGPGKSCGASH